MSGSIKEVDSVQFILTSDGRLGVGYNPRNEQGGFHVLKWCPDDMIKQAAKRVLFGPADKPGETNG